MRVPYTRTFPVALAALALALGAVACSSDDNKDDGSSTPAVETATPPSSETAPSATPAASDIAEDSAPVMAARQTLLDNVAIEPADLHFVSATAQTFSNSCLDVTTLTATPLACAQVITPGYEVIFSVGTTFYTFHTDEAGTNVQFANVQIGDGPTDINVP